MGLKENFVEQIMNCSWFENCGDVSFDKFEVVFLKNKSEVVKSIKSIKWENICLEKQGDFTFYLSQNCKKQYNEMWNTEVKNVKNMYISKLSKGFKAGLLKSNLPLDILDDIKFNVVTLFMLNYFSDYYTSEFFEQMLQIYLSGHLPCGWSDNVEGGKFKVY